MFEKVKNFYDIGVYTKQQVKALVGKKNGITPKQYEDIVHEPYTN